MLELISFEAQHLNCNAENCSLCRLHHLPTFVQKYLFFAVFFCFVQINNKECVFCGFVVPIFAIFPRLIIYEWVFVDQVSARNWTNFLLSETKRQFCWCLQTTGDDLLRPRLRVVLAQSLVTVANLYWLQKNLIFKFQNWRANKSLQFTYRNPGLL